MNAAVFVDTNIFLYAIDEEPANGAKRSKAQELLLNESWCWSVHVAAEFFVNATSLKRPFRLSSTDAAALVNTWLKYPTASITTDLVRAAISIHDRYQLSYWDAAIIMDAREWGCATVYSEDLNNAQRYDGVQVVNPFVNH
jgi:predicted nucleic acid-binding protein